MGVFFNFSEGGWRHADNVQGGVVLVNVFTPLQEILYPRLDRAPPPKKKKLYPISPTGMHSGGRCPFSKNSCVRRECPIRHLLKTNWSLRVFRWWVHGLLTMGLISWGLCSLKFEPANDPVTVDVTYSTRDFLSLLEEDWETSEGVSGGLTPCRQLGPSSRREHVQWRIRGGDRRLNPPPPPGFFACQFGNYGRPYTSNRVCSHLVVWENTTERTSPVHGIPTRDRPRDNNMALSTNSVFKKSSHFCLKKAM